MRRRLTLLALALLWGLAGPAPAQTMASGDTPRVTMPKARTELSANYPEGGHGDAVVVLELVVEADGGVSEASVVSGEEPFASSALEAARRFSFLPAMRDENPLRSRIRVEVRFVEELGEEAAVPGPASQDATESPSAPLTEEPEPGPIEILVEGRREPEQKTLRRAEVRALPGAFGDPFRAVESMPGVTPFASGLPYFYVRGAPPGNTGYFFDGVRVPVLFHAAVGPSVIHPAFIDKVTLYPGPYPARYGHYAGGIVAGESAPPGDRFRGEASIRLVDAGAMIEAPLDDRAQNSVMLAGRYSYTGAVISLIVPELELGYWDYQARGSFSLDRRDTVTLFAFGSHDFARQLERGKFRTIFDITFHRVSLGLTRRLSGKDTISTRATFGLDQSSADDGRFDVQNRAAAARSDFAHEVSQDVLLRTGLEAEINSYRVDLGPAIMDEPDEIFDPNFDDREDVTVGSYVETLLEPERGILITPGLRVDGYASGAEQAFGVSPRLEAEFSVSDRFTLTHGVGVAQQPPSFTIPIPGFQPDLAGGLQTSYQSSAGARVRLGWELEGSVTLFQSVTTDLTDRIGVSRLDNGDPNVDADSRSLGSARGMELLLKRSLAQKVGGFIAYTLSRSERSLGRADGPASADRAHVLNLALAGELGAGFRAGGRFVFYTGIPGDVAYVEVARHPPRTPAFYRLDFRVEKRWPFLEHGFWAVVLEVMNTTFHKEVLNESCSAYSCREEIIGPITFPSLGVEAAL